MRSIIALIINLQFKVKFNLINVDASKLRSGIFESSLASMAIKFETFVENATIAPFLTKSGDVISILLYPSTRVCPVSEKEAVVALKNDEFVKIQLEHESMTPQ